MSKVMTVDQAMDLIKDGDLIATSAYIQGTTAEYIMRSLEERYVATGHPANLGLMAAGSAGMGGGIRGYGHDHFCHDGMLGRVYGGHFGLAPNLQDYIAANKCQAYNFPLGVVSHMYREATLGRKYYYTNVGLNTFIDPRIEGARLNTVTTENIIRVVDIDGEEMLAYPIPQINACLIRGNCADPEGNVCCDEELNPRGIDMYNIATATHKHGGKVIVQVKEIVPTGSLTGAQITISGVFVDALVVCPDPEKEHRQTVGSFYRASQSGKVNVLLDNAKPMKLNERKVMARRAAMEMTEHALVNLGIGIPEGVADICAEEGLTDQLTLTTESGAIGGVPQGGQNFGPSLNALGYIEMCEMFDLYNGGNLDLSVLGLAECNAKGDINVSKFGIKNPGAGGFINISQNSPTVVFVGSFTAGKCEDGRGLELEFKDGELHILHEGKNRKFVKEVQQITFASEYGVKTGQNVLYATERCVFKLTKDGIMLTEIAPGVDLEKDILANMDFKPLIAEKLELMDARLFKDEKMNLQVKARH